MEPVGRNGHGSVRGVFDFRESSRLIENLTVSGRVIEPPYRAPEKAKNLSPVRSLLAGNDLENLCEYPFPVSHKYPVDQPLSVNAVPDRTIEDRTGIGVAAAKNDERCSRALPFLAGEGNTR